MKQINCLVLFAFPNTFSYKSMYKSSSVQSIFYKCSPCFTNPIQFMFYNMPDYTHRESDARPTRVRCLIILRNILPALR